MAMTLNAGAVKREDMFRINPYEIHVKEKSQCRHFQPTDAEIIAKTPTARMSGFTPARHDHGTSNHARWHPQSTSATQRCPQYRHAPS